MTAAAAPRLSAACLSFRGPPVAAAAGKPMCYLGPFVNSFGGLEFQKVLLENEKKTVDKPHVFFRWKQRLEAEGCAQVTVAKTDLCSEV